MYTVSIRSSFLLLFCSLGLMLTACQHEEQSPPDSKIDGLVTVTPKLIKSMDHIDDLFFSHLGYESIVLENGNIAFADRQIPAIAIINQSGELQKTIQEGRGPGEILDAYAFSKDASGNIYTYDQGNNKILVFDTNFDFLREVIPPAYKSTSLIKAYASSNEEFLFEFTSFEFLEDMEKEKRHILVPYDPEEEEYGEEKTYSPQPSARLIIDGQLRGATQVPYAPGTITSYNVDEGTLFLFDTGSDSIIEINTEFDTLRTIPVNLPTEKISEDELDTIESEASFSEEWKAVSELLPEVKAPADKMIYHKGEFWLKSNIKKDTEMWLVVTMDGVIDRVVHLPKESMLMHISEEHLGVRLDDVTFALFTNPKPEPLN